MTDYKVHGWYPKGSRPRKQFIFDNNHRTYVTGAYSTNGIIYSKQYDQINNVVLLSFIKVLLKKHKKLLLIMDNVSMHFTKNLGAVYKTNNIAIIRFPKYSPQLNPIEQYWKNIKQWLGTKLILRFKDLKKAVDVALKDISLWPKSYGYIVT